MKGLRSQLVCPYHMSLFKNRMALIFNLEAYYHFSQLNNGPIKNNWSDIGKFVDMSHFVKIDIKGIFLKFHNVLIS